MAMRLGLDIGTGSIGWCLVEDGEIRDLGVRIFSGSPTGAGRDPKTGASLAEERRGARAMRRRRDRYLGRRSAFLDALVAHGLMPADPEAARQVASLCPYRLRRRALDEKLAPDEIGRALFHLNQRRGFKSNRRADRTAEPGEKGKIESGAEALDAAMETADARTLGEFLAMRLEAGDAARVRLNSDNQGYDFYPQRHHILNEFKAIWDSQKAHHPDLMTEAAHEALWRVIEFQRPLKAQEVGYCTFSGMNGVPADERRLSKAHPLFQQRRLYEEVNQLRVTAPGVADRPLSIDERDALILKLQDKRKVLFSSLAKTLKLQPGERFNKESENRKDLAGDEVRAELGDAKRFGSRWLHFTPDEQWAIIQRLQHEEDADALRAWLRQAHGLDEAAAQAVAAANLPQGYGRFGPTATRRLIAALKADVVTYDKAAEAAGFHHSDHRNDDEIDQLPYYGEVLARHIAPGKAEYGDPLERRYGKITNPTVHIGLRQLQTLVNAIITRHRRPDQIVVELARELKLNDKQKEEHKRRNRDNLAAAQKRSAKLLELGQVDSGANRMLLRLWEELAPDNFLNRCCPYCGETIGLAMLFSSEVQIDHIIPYSRCLDDSPGNKVVSHRRCNQAKGNKTPYEKWGPHKNPERWERISAQVAQLHRSKQWRFGPDAMERVERDGGFIARQLTDTQYLSRIAGEYLRRLYAEKGGGSARVYVVPGRMTAMLRRLWGLNDLLWDHNFVENEHSNAPKNRLDHRHHVIDAAIMAVTGRDLLGEIAKTAARSEEENLDRLFTDLPQPWPGFREELRARLQGVNVSHKPDHGRQGHPPRHRDTTAGQLHNDTAYGFTGEMMPDGRTPIVVHRVPLMSLKPGDLINPLRIPDDRLRDALWSATRDRTGKDFERALARFAASDPVFKGIRRLRVREPLNIIPISDRQGRVYKGYKGSANARYDIWRLPDGKWTADVISMFDAHQRNQDDRRPHPAARKMLSLRQNDLIAVERDGGARELLRITGFNQQGRLTLAPPNEAGALQARDAASNQDDPFKYIYLSGRSLQKYKARQVRIDALGRVFDPGPRE